MSRLWLLNLGAELELEGRQHSKAARAMSKTAAKTLAETLVPGGDEWVVDAPRATGEEEPREGRAFLPTPAAIQTLLAAGAAIEAPAVAVLRQANSREFSVAHFPRADVYLVRVERDLRAGGERLFKRDLSFAGGGQRRVSANINEDDRAWLRASLARGPVCVEPWYRIENEVGVPGFVHRDGRIDVGSPVQQIVVRGQWRESRGTKVDLLALRDTCHKAGRHLADLGYFGPFNIDAHQTREHGWTHVSEINARYTMGWALGWLPGSRPDVR